MTMCAFRSTRMECEVYMKELDVVKLINDFENLKKGTEGTIVYEHGKNFFEVEFFDDDNETIGVYTISGDNLEVINEWK